MQDIAKCPQVWKYLVLIKLLTDDVWCCVAVPSEVLSSLGSFAGGGEVLGLGDLSSSSSSEELSLKERYCLFHFFNDGA